MIWRATTCGDGLEDAVTGHSIRGERTHGGVGQGTKSPAQTTIVEHDHMRMKWTQSNRLNVLIIPLGISLLCI